jgi:hypothetical protein
VSPTVQSIAARAAALTDEQIRDLRGLAREDDDDDLVAVCNSALIPVGMAPPGESIDSRTPDECRLVILAVLDEIAEGR